MASLTIPAALFSSSNQITNRPRINARATGNGRRPWWSPLFHAAFSDHDKSEEQEEEAKVGSPASISFSTLTPEKARVLRREMRATETWHDAMYHSAIASRLASPDQA